MNQLDVDYFQWLTSLIQTPIGKTYGLLFERMHNLEFLWTVPHDENRIQDGADLRSEFCGETRQHLQLEFVTTLEVLVALSRRLAFVAGGEEEFQAWNLLKNLKLHKMSDPLTQANANRIEAILEALIWRTYRQDGHGGFFPLNNPEEDQTKVEIWNQMQHYVTEMQAL